MLSRNSIKKESRSSAGMTTIKRNDSD